MRFQRLWLVVAVVGLWGAANGCGSSGTPGAGSDATSGSDSGGHTGSGHPTSSGNGGGGNGNGGGGGATGGGGAGGGPCVPDDDANECTDDLCATDGTTVHTPKPAGSACLNGGSKCDASGQCVECLAPSDCPGVDDACQTRACATGTCGFDFTSPGTPIPTQTPGDCKVTVCDGNGGTADQNDDQDVPVDNNPCTDDVCTAGVPSNPLLAQGVGCGNGGNGASLVCDAQGQCVGCNTAADCAGVDDECKTRTCTAGVCGFSFTDVDTPIAAQTDRDCLVQVCDGAGNVKANADDADVPADDGNPCTDEACAGGSPIHPDKPTGALCDDADACTLGDSCQAGACVPGTPVTCGAQDQCHTAGTCDSATGLCSNPAKSDGAACNDGDACTQTDTCQAGVCAGSSPVTCTAQDQCHSAGTCDAATGACSNPAKADGAACNDGDACTQTDTCQAGVCTGGNPVACAALDQCHTAGTCDSATGACSNPNAANGTVCNDGDACTQTDTCQTGVCTGGNPVTCTALDQCHTAGTCAPGTGVCSNPSKANGTVCSDGDACTQTDTCQTGVCTGGNPVTCTALDQCHTAGTCAPATGVCSNPNAANGTVCNDGDACTQTDTCQAGTCTGGNPVVCTALDTCHTAGACAPATGACSNPAKANGSACNDGNACTQTDTCTAGVCSGSNAGETVTVGPGINLAITDNGYNGTLASMACVNVVVPAACTTTSSVVLKVGMDHTWIGDLVFKLVHPDGTVVTLMSVPGLVEAADDGTGASAESSNLSRAFPITFQMGAATSSENMGNTIANAGVVCRDDGLCTFAPSRGAAAAGNLNTFVGKNPTGTWKFCVGDGAVGDVGTIDQVVLTIGG